MNFFIPKLMKSRWFFFFFWVICSSLPNQVEFGSHASNLNSIFVSMNELKFFLLTGVLTPNFNTMDLVKFLGKNKKLHIQIVAVTLKVTSYRTMSKKQK
jgi:hypothetical protein